MKWIILLSVFLSTGCATFPNDSYLKYNYMENRWEMTQQDSRLMFNYMEKKYEYVPTK